MFGVFRHAKSEVTSHARSWFVNVVLLGVGYCVLLAILGDEVLPYAPLFSLLLVWFCALLAGIAFRTFLLPPLLGQLLVGMLLQNVPGEILRGLRESWVAGVRTMALSFVLMRAGLGMNIQEARKLGGLAFLVAFVPGLCESIAVGAVGVPLFGYPWALSLANGFIVAAVSAAVVVVEILDLGVQYNGLGQVHGVSTLLVFAVTGDIVLAVSGYTLCSGLAYGNGSLVWNILFGPVNVLAGTGAGIVVGALLWLTSLIRSGWKTVAFLVASNVAIVFAFQTVLFTGAASVSAVLIPIVAVLGWKNAYPTPWLMRYNENAAECDSDPSPYPAAERERERGASLQSGRARSEMDSAQNESRTSLESQISRPVARFLARFSWLRSEKHPEYVGLSSQISTFVWAIFVAPALFGTIGTALDFDLMTIAVVGKGVALIAIGVAVRILSGMLVVIGSPLTLTERYYVSISMASKATIQAALGGLPLQFYSNQPDATGEQLRWGQEILVISTLSILLTAPAGMYFMRTMGPKWLSPPDDLGRQSSATASVLNVRTEESHHIVGVEELRHSGSLKSAHHHDLGVSVHDEQHPVEVDVPPPLQKFENESGT